MNADPLSVLSQPFIFDHAIDLGKYGVVPAYPNIQTRMNFSAELANQDTSCPYLSPTESLYSPPLTSAVPTVSGAALTFLMSHNLPPML
jgi:hypothetical protein